MWGPCSTNLYLTVWVGAGSAFFTGFVGEGGVSKVLVVSPLG